MRKTLLALLAVVALIGDYLIWEASAHVRGKLVAHADVARGHYEIQVLGLAPRWRSEYSRILRERYGIETREVAGCFGFSPGIHKRIQRSGQARSDRALWP
ncbi:MAG TPA: hypothetical protein VKE70_13185 [Candidatus Solibacter sp.]|nr:hypothetical protein [Candidatus Solibacter sp.]